MAILNANHTGPWFNIKMTSYQYRKSHCGDKTVVRSSYLHNGISYTGKMSSLYWIGAQEIITFAAGLQIMFYIYEKGSLFVYVSTSPQNINFAIANGCRCSKTASNHVTAENMVFLYWHNPCIWMKSFDFKSLNMVNNKHIGQLDWLLVTVPSTYSRDIWHEDVPLYLSKIWYNNSKSNTTTMNMS